MAQDVCVHVHMGPHVSICVGVHAHVCKRVLSSARRPEHLEAQREQTRTDETAGSGCSSRGISRVLPKCRDRVGQSVPLVMSI